MKSINRFGTCINDIPTKIPINPPIPAQQFFHQPPTVSNPPPIFPPMDIPLNWSDVNDFIPSEMQEIEQTGFKNKRSIPMFQDYDDEYFFLNGLYGSNVVLMQNEEKTFAISPEQYQKLLMGFNQSLHYRMESPDYKQEDVDGFNYKPYDLWRFRITSRICRHQLHAEEYQQIEGFCEGSILTRFPAAMQFLQNKQDCNVDNAYIQSLGKMENLTYPFEKTYQDPVKVWIN